MILGFTGHRPASLPGSYSDRTNRALLNTSDFILAQYKPTKVISGMALGWDTAVAQQRGWTSGGNLRVFLFSTSS